MKLKIKNMNLSTGGPYVAILNEEDAEKLDLYALDRIRIDGFSVTINIATKGVKKGQIGLFEEVLNKLKLRAGTTIKITPQTRPTSVRYIKKKLKGKRLKQNEINEIISDIVSNRLSEVEISYFASACYTKDLSLNETYYLTQAIVKNSKSLDLKGKKILDKHCLSADIPVMVKNSGNTKVEPIGEIIDSVFKRCSQAEIINLNGAEFTNKKLRNLNVPTYNDKGIVSYKPVTGVFRAKSPKQLYNITLKGNRNIKTTSDHTIFTLKKGKITNIPAKEIKKGDFVIVPSSLEQNKNIKFIEINTEQGIRNYKTFPKKIAITPEFIRLLAYYIAEGFTNYQGVFLNFGSHETKMIEDSIKCIKKIFRFSPTINKPHKTATRICIYNKTIAKIFKEELKLGLNALNKKIPSFVFDIHNELKKEFLRTLIECDGHVRRGYEAEYGTSSKKLATQLQYMLSSLNIAFSTNTNKETTRKFKTQTCKIQEHYKLYMQAREIFYGRQRPNVAFTNLLPIKEIGEVNTKEIGWEFRRELKRQKYITKQKLKKIQNHIQSKDIDKFLDGHLSVLEVKSVDKTQSPSKYVYDFKVDGYNKFMAGTAPICVHNCVGGIPGNRTTMIVVPIVAALGYTIPKTSSRSITSASGTSDTMETLANVTLTTTRIKEVLKKTNACLVWGGVMELASADDSLIRVERPLSLDPEGVLIASILSKKKSVNATHVLIDIPVGKNAKITSLRRAKRLRNKFISVGRKLGMKIKVVFTHGDEPVGNGVGPALEAVDVLEVLKGKGPKDLRNKSITLATMLLELAGEKHARKKVLETLHSGKAFEKMKEIIKAQGRSKHKLKIGKYFQSIPAKKSGYVREIKNSEIARIARIAGSPKDKGAGIYLNIHKDNKIKKGEILMTIYAENRKKLEYALDAYKKTEVIKIGS